MKQPGNFGVRNVLLRYKPIPYKKDTQKNSVLNSGGMRRDCAYLLCIPFERQPVGGSRLPCLVNLLPHSEGANELPIPVSNETYAK